MVSNRNIPGQNNSMPEQPEPEYYGEEEQTFSRWLEQSVHKTPWWLISIVFHVLIILIATQIVVESRELVEEKIIQISPSAPITELPDIPPPEAEVDNKNSLTEEQPEEEALTEAEDIKNESEDDEEYEQRKGESEEFKSDAPVHNKGVVKEFGVGSGGLAGRFGGRFGGKQDRRKRGGAGSRNEEAVLAGLIWLARHQNKDGSWSATRYTDNCATDKGGTCKIKVKTYTRGEGDELKVEERDEGWRTGSFKIEPGMTGLALLAFLGAGYTTLSKDKFKDPVTGKEYIAGTIVSNGINWLIKNQNKDGSICSVFDDKSKTGCERMMYCHSISALALSEAYGLVPPNPFLKDAAQKAINFLVDAQSRIEGSDDPAVATTGGVSLRAWRYNPRSSTNDISVTGWCVMALKSAELSGLTFDKASYEGTINFVNELTNKEMSYRVGYMNPEDAALQPRIVGENDGYTSHPAATAIAMMCRAFIEKKLDSTPLKEGARIVSQDPPYWEDKDKRGTTKDYYYWYYASLALFQFDGPDTPGRSGKYWGEWNTRLIAAVEEHQYRDKKVCSYGSWLADDKWGCEGGRVYATAINTLTLEVYYRYDSAFAPLASTTERKTTRKKSP